MLEGNLLWALGFQRSADPSLLDSGRMPSLAVVLKNVATQIIVWTVCKELCSWGLCFHGASTFARDVPLCWASTGLSSIFSKLIWGVSWVTLPPSPNFLLLSLIFCHLDT